MVANCSKVVPYWRACAGDLRLSDALQHMLSVWREANGRIYLTRAGSLGEYFGPLSYYCILIGMGHLPRAGPPLFAVADATNLEREWHAESAKAQQMLPTLHEDDLSKLRHRPVLTTRMIQWSWSLA